MKTNITRSFITRSFILAFVLALLGFRVDSEITTVVRPIIISTSPVDGATNVPLQINMTINFSQAMSHESLRDSTAYTLAVLFLLMTFSNGNC